MPLRKKTARGKYARRTEPDPRLSEILSKIASSDEYLEQRELIIEAVELLYCFKPHKEQVDCIQWLLYRQEDLVLVAKTSFGKSLIMQVLPCLRPRSIMIVILPLLALGSEQENAIKKQLSPKSAARPVFINSSNISKDMLQEVKTGRYTHILISPELIVGSRFQPILKERSRGLVARLLLTMKHGTKYAILLGSKTTPIWFGHP